MRVSVSYAKASEHHPAQVVDIIAKIRKGKSQSKNDAPETFNWEYTWGVKVQAMSIQQLISSVHQPKMIIPSAAEELKDAISRCTPVNLLAVKGRGAWTASSPVAIIPSEVIEWHKNAIDAEWRRKADFEALPKAEQDRQVSKALDYLTGPRNSGFMAVQVRARPSLFETALKRPADFFGRSAEEQWAIDKSLGILDWEGECAHQASGACKSCQERWTQHFKP